MFSNIRKYENVYRGDNLSDHIPVSLSLDIDVCYSHEIKSVLNEKLLWSAATDLDIDQYKRKLDIELSSIVLPVDALYCSKLTCNEHNHELQILYYDIVEACLRASNIIPSIKQNIHNVFRGGQNV